MNKFLVSWVGGNPDSDCEIGVYIAQTGEDAIHAALIAVAEEAGHPCASIEDSKKIFYRHAMAWQRVCGVNEKIVFQAVPIA